MLKQIDTYCRICEPNCPLTATLNEQKEIQSLTPNLKHPSKGVACHKGIAYLDLHNDSDRLDYPIKRKNSKSESKGEFERISWETATEDIAARLNSIIDKYGPNAIATFGGNPSVFNARLLTYSGAFNKIIGTEMIFTANTQDMSNRMVAGAAIYGTAAVLVPDLANTDYLLCMGSNPRVSKWTVTSVVNDAGKTMENIKQRGGKICFINPRKTESSTPETGETLRIKPGTDVYFLAAVLHEISISNGLDKSAIEEWGNEADKALDFVSNYSVEQVTGITGLSANEIRTVARDIMFAPSACIYISVGVNQGGQGTLAAWLADMIIFMTGNLGKKGGMYKPTGFSDMYQPTPVFANKVNTSIGELFYTLPGPAPLPAVALPELIENGDIKALINISGNPIMSTAGEHKWRKALNHLDLLVSLDLNRNMTAEMSDYVLPGTDFLERADFNMINNGGQQMPYLQYTDAVVEPKAERKDDWRILVDLLKAMGRFPGDDPEGFGIITKILSMCGYDLEALKKAPHQTQLIEPTPYDDLYQKLLKHEDGKVHCFPASFEANGLFERCAKIYKDLVEEPANTLKMITLRTPHMHNTWMQNIDKFRRGRQSINPLHISEEDAERLHLIEGEHVKVHNEYGQIESPVTIDADLRSGVVAMSHGYGKGRYGQRTAERNPGANSNTLAPNTMETVEPVSNMTWISAYPVEIEKLN